MSFEVMENLGLKIDTTEARCFYIEQREVTFIGIISALVYILSTYLDKELTISVLVVEIPPQYGMLLSRKWSTTMGESLQCDPSH